MVHSPAVPLSRSERIREPFGNPMSERSGTLAVPVDVTMWRPTLSGVPEIPSLAASLVVRRARVEEAGDLAALLGRAFEAESWDAAGTERELFRDETVMATSMVAAGGRLVAERVTRLLNGEAGGGRVEPPAG